MQDLVTLKMLQYNNLNVTHEFSKEAFKTATNFGKVAKRKKNIYPNLIIKKNKNKTSQEVYFMNLPMRRMPNLVSFCKIAKAYVFRRQNYFKL